MKKYFKEIKWGRMAVGVVCCSFMFARSSYAYIDPGNGSYLFQILAASGLVLLLSIKTFFRSLLTFFAGLFGKKNKENKK